MDFKSFIIGSSFLVFVHFFVSVQLLDPKIVNFDYKTYTLIAPLYLGFMNMIGGSLFQGSGRYLWTGILSGLIVASVARMVGSYNYDENRWLEYSIYIILKHIVTFHVIIGTLSKFI